MSFKRKSKSSEGDFELPPGGSYAAVFIGLIDLGTQPREYNGKKWEEDKVYLLWELTGEADSEGDNFVVGKDYTFSLHEKANLRKMIEAYYGKRFPDDYEFDLLLLMGKPCVLGISEGKSGNDKKYVEVTSVAQPTKGQIVPPPVRKLFIFDFEFVENPAIDPVIPDWVPPLYGRRIVDEIKQSPQWKRLAGPGISASAPPNGATVTNPSAVQPVASDCPF